MEIRAFAERILLTPSLEAKLAPFEKPLSDLEPGPVQRVECPARPPELVFAAPRTAPSLPHPHSLSDPAKRALAHHILANHELQALEVMAWTLLAFPAAPAEFRSGLVWIMEEEQRHTRMHVERAAKLGLRFGERPVNWYIWRQTRDFTDVLDYLACLPLLFESRNLDHSLELAEAFANVGDDRSAALLRTIHRDEIEHVAFGLKWLRHFKPQAATDWEAFSAHLHWPLRPAKSRGAVFQRDARLSAGMSPEFLEQLEQALDD